MIGLAELQRAIDGSGGVEDRRVCRLLDGLADTSATSRDIAPLLRQVLLAGGPSSTHSGLVVADRAGLAQACADAQLITEPFGVDRLRVSVDGGVRLDWLEGRSRWLDLATVAPGTLATEHQQVNSLSRQQRPVTADPSFERLTRHRSHPLPEQREAVRQVTLAPPGSVTHVVLPTGAGKTIIGLLPALAERSAQVVVVVPTIAIALDQERAILAARDRGDVWEHAPDRVAWHAGLGAAERAVLRERLLAGQQRVLFTSHESLVSSLEPTLLAAANRGRIHTLVFDEAHLISVWGADFRPELQLAASVRQQLLQATARSGTPAVRTVLLTATLDRQALDLNARLFPSSDGPRVVGAAALRTEPRFLRAAIPREQRLHRLVELLAVAPRPTIVYATSRSFAEQAYQHLRANGLARTALFTGDTEGQDRQEILDKWRGGTTPSTVDVVVGTAAFGLGVDQSDVRCVVHVEAPASVGAFYQEVGRAGRDGHACVSVLLADDKNLAGSLRIGDVTFISPEKAWRRWEAMATTLSDTSPSTVDVRVVPAHIRGSSDRNELWNRNTLVLMQRAGLIRLLPQPLPDPSDGDDAWEQRRGRLAVEFLVDEQLTFGVLRRCIGEVVERFRDARAEDHAAVADLVGGDRCFGELFAAAYTFDLTVDGERVRSRPSAACSGCPGCRRARLQAAAPPVASFPGRPDGELGSALSRIAGSSRSIVVHDDADWLHRSGPELLARLVSAGCRHLYLNRPDQRLLKSLQKLPYVALDPEPVGFRPFVRPSVLWRPARIDPTWRSGHGQPRILVVESSTTAPDRPDQRLADWWSPARRARDLMELL